MPIDRRIKWAVFGCLTALVGLLSPWLPGKLSFRPVKAAPSSQEGFFPHARLSSLDIQDFPQVRTYLEVFDSGGSFVSDLSAEEVELLEDEQPLPLSEITALEPGVQVTIAITFGPSMGIRDGLGMTRYDYLLEVFKTWDWSTHRQSPDDLSLIIDGGPEAVHLDDPDPIMGRLVSFNPDPRQSVPNLQTLSRAMEIALDPVDHPGMHRAVLFITPPLGIESVAGLQSLTAQAVQGEVSVFIWQIAAIEALDSPAVQQMQKMAAETGGEFLNYSGVEELPNIETYLAPLRPTYQLTYTSKVASSGVHTVRAVIQRENLELQSQPRTFEINLQPPNPVFMALPSQIERHAERTDEMDQPGGQNQVKLDLNEIPESEPPTDEPIKTESPSYVLLPEEKELQVFIEFPDGYKRSLTESTLVVDGVVVWHNRTPPFDTFTWNLRSYNENGLHSVQVVITDILGMQGASAALPVEVNVVGVPIPLSERFSGRGLWVGGVAVMVVAAIIGFVLILGGRLQPYSAYRAIFSRNRPASSFQHRGEREKPPKPGSVKESYFGLPGWISRSALQRGHASHKALAYLVPVHNGDTPTRESPIPLLDKEIILGRDPRQVTRVLPDPSLEDIHSRFNLEGGRFRLFDFGTTAGTWVNFHPVPKEGILLRHGDLVHIGRSAFRFTARDSKDARKPVIISVEQTRDET